jgi:general secretion pathway protein A
MYASFYGLKTLPFNITSNPNFFFESVSHKEALSCLLYGISSKTGLMLITGEVGTGKTTLCKTLLSKLPPEVKTSFIYSIHALATCNFFRDNRGFRIASGKKEPPGNREKA